MYIYKNLYVYISTKFPHNIRTTNRKMQRHQQQFKQVESTSTFDPGVMLCISFFHSFTRSFVVLFSFCSFFSFFLFFFSFFSLFISFSIVGELSYRSLTITRYHGLRFGLAEIFLLFDFVVFALRISYSVCLALSTVTFCYADFMSIPTHSHHTSYRSVFRTVESSF